MEKIRVILGQAASHYQIDVALLEALSSLKQLELGDLREITRCLTSYLSNPLTRNPFGRVVYSSNFLCYLSGVMFPNDETSFHQLVNLYEKSNGS